MKPKRGNGLKAIGIGLCLITIQLITNQCIKPDQTDMGYGKSATSSVHPTSWAKHEFVDPEGRITYIYTSFIELSDCYFMIVQDRNLNYSILQITQDCVPSDSTLWRLKMQDLPTKVLDFK